MRDRERVRGGDPLGQPRRYSSSPVGRFSWGDWESGRVPHMGWDRDDEDDWTEVRPRRRKERRQVNDGGDGSRQSRRHRSFATSRPRQLFVDEHYRNRNHAHDQNHDGVFQTRYNTGARRESRWPAKRTHDGPVFPLQHGERRQERADWRSSGKARMMVTGAAWQNVVVNQAWLNVIALKGFEVCGMMEDVYVPKKRNALAVCFGHFRVRAKVEVLIVMTRMKEGEGEGIMVGSRKEGTGRMTKNINSLEMNGRKGVDETNTRVVPKAKERDGPLEITLSKGSDSEEGV
ncbi:hypothetical protein A2U01_0004460, partial [Trifolium medium]|nr:hypothetical protein [Trifolium medium]